MIGIIVIVGLIWLLNAPDQVSLGSINYLVPKKAQFAARLRSPGEVSLMLTGAELAAHIPGYHATLRTYLNGEQGAADIPVEFQSGENFNPENAGTNLGMEIPKRVLTGQEEAPPACFESRSDDGTPNQMCTFVYRDRGLRLQFLLRDDNLEFGPEVARYALNSLERYRQR